MTRSVKEIADEAGVTRDRIVRLLEEVDPDHARWHKKDGEREWRVEDGLASEAVGRMEEDSRDAGFFVHSIKDAMRATGASYAIAYSGMLRLDPDEEHRRFLAIPPSNRRGWLMDDALMDALVDVLGGGSKRKVDLRQRMADIEQDIAFLKHRVGLLEEGRKGGRHGA